MTSFRLLYVSLSAIASVGVSSVQAAPSANKHPSVLDLVWKFVPSQLKEIEPGKTTVPAARARLGAPKRVEAPSRTTGSTSWFYELAGVQYDTTLKVDEKNGRVIGVIHRFANFPFTLETVKSALPEAEWKTALASAEKQPRSAMNDAPIVLRLPQFNVILIFEPQNPHPLRQVEFIAK